MQASVAIESDGFVVATLRDGSDLIERIGAGDRLGALIAQSLAWAALGGAIFGASLGSYGQHWAQILASTLKVPLLLVGSALICFPTFYVLQVVKSPHPLSFLRAAALMTTSLAATALVWASFTAPTLFLISTTYHYELAQYLALGIGAAGGGVGLTRFLMGYRRLCDPDRTRPLRGDLWLFAGLYAVVGAQLAWVLRPFIGAPSLGFEFIRPLEGNILTHVLGLVGG